MMCSTSTGDTTDNDKIDKYTKGLISTMAHLMGLREDKNGKLQVTVGTGDDDDDGRICIENINLQMAQQWEAGALLNVVEDLKILPVEKITKIRRDIDEASKKNVDGGGGGNMSKPGGVPKPSTSNFPSSTGGKSITAGAPCGNTGTVKTTNKISNVEDPFAVSKGPSGFYPPRKVAAAVAPSSSKNNIPEAGDIPTELMQRKQFTFSKPKSMEDSSANRNFGNQTSLFSTPDQPPNKRLALQPPANWSSTKPVGMDVDPAAIKPYLNPGFSVTTTSFGEEGGQRGAVGAGSFKSAYQQLIIDDKRKGIQRTLPPPATGGNARAPGLRRPPPRSEPEKPIKQSNSNSDDDSKVSDNPEVQELMEHESMKNIDPKMVEAILNEVMQVATTEWSDIAGLDGVKKIIQEIIIWPMERPDIFVGLRAAPRGILFFGPPGTGKTLFGRVIATQSKSTFFNISASSLTSKWIGDGEKMVRALFAVARLKQPSVIFIDEIDSILTQRSDTEHESSRRLKTEFLIQFDGCATSTADRILVIGVTNRPQELDEAARRRLVKRIYIPLPDFTARKQLVKNLIKGYTSDLTEEDFDKIAKITEGYSGADMTSLCREAAYGPIREVGHLLQNLDVSSVRPMQMKDFAQAHKQVKSSVGKSDVALYEEWDAKFGCQIGPTTEDDSFSQFSQLN